MKLMFLILLGALHEGKQELARSNVKSASLNTCENFICHLCNVQILEGFIFIIPFFNVLHFKCQLAFKNKDTF